MQTLLSSIGFPKKALSVQSTKAFVTLIQTVKPTVFWEVGNSIGAYSWLALEHSRTCKAMLFEADSANYSAMLRTIDRRQLHRANAINLVVSTVSSSMGTCAEPAADAMGTRPKYLSLEQEARRSVAVQRDGDGMERNAVERLTLDGLLARGYASPDIIKINTPDAEQVVMDGARTVLETCSPILIVQTASHNLVRYLEGMSYRSFPFDQDNLIFISVYF